MSDLLELGERLTIKGPDKVEATPRRVRGLFGGKYIFDTLEASYVWEHPYYPYFYIPVHAFIPGVLSKTEPSSSRSYWLGSLTVGSANTSRILGFDAVPLRNLVRVEHAVIDWFVEDEKLLGPHPKDPFKRIETIPSSREITIKVNGKEVAKSTQNVFLFETLLRPRYYLSAVGVKWEYLRDNKTTTYCPYKGMANYYDVVVDDLEIKDAIWYYRYPTAESALVAGRLCFYNEKVDVFIDGVKESRDGPTGHD